AGVVAAIVHALQNPITDWYWAAVWLALVAGLAALMVSPIRFYSFKEVNFGRRRTTTVIGIGLLIVLIWKFSRPVLLIIAVTYLLAGLVGPARRRLLGHTG
ncbi:MAG: CDP-diacylglycerol--serine O-phosphatidyltransferase, partial [Gemmatimonadales bacterium]